MSTSRLAAVLGGLVALSGVLGAQTLQTSVSNVLAMDDVEITPDQRYAVVRENRSIGYARVYDLATGQLAANPALGSFSEVCGEVLDAVAVTNTRAIVLGGRRAAILDLTNLANPLVAEVLVGDRPNDVAITPDGTLAVVRGGNSDGTVTGGTFVFRLADGAQLAFHPGAAPRYDFSGTVPYSFNTDSVAVTNRHAITLSILQATPSGPADTRVTIWDLQHSSGVPTVILETGAPGGRGDLRGAPHDVAISPDGHKVLARSEQGFAAWLVAGSTVQFYFGGGLTNDPGPFSDTAMDSVEVTNTRFVTLSNVAGAPTPGETQVDIVALGNYWTSRIPGRPHDLAITPDGRFAIVRTGAVVALYGLENMGMPGPIAPIDTFPEPAGSDGYLGGLDSVAASNDAAVTIARSGAADTRAVFWSLARGRLQRVSSTLIPGSRPLDVVLTPDRRRVVVGGTTKTSVFHLGSGGRAFEHQAVIPNNFYPWCDGAAASQDRVVGIGMWGPQAGWITTVDATPLGTRYCTANANSTGRAASILAMGRASVTANSLKLCVDGAARGARGRFVQGTTQALLPFGDGVQCVGGTVFGLRFLDTNVGGSGFLPVNFAAQTVPAGMVQPGSTWHYQYVFLDPDSSGFGINSSDAVAITFGP